MIKIQLEAGALETYTDTEIQLSWDAFRFQTEIRDAFTNDVSIPKTKENVRILSAVGLLDSETQLFGEKTTHADLMVNSTLIPVYVQVVAVRADEIDICLYEDVLPADWKEKIFTDGFIDNPSTIYEWNPKSVEYYPDVFRTYRYGMKYDTKFAQYHPSTSLDNMFAAISSAGYSLPSVNTNYRLLATGKKVCPQNQTQVFEVSWVDSNYGIMNGGNHICNDLCWSWNPDMHEITFNRQCNVTMTVYIAYDLKSTHTETQNKFFQLIMKRQGAYPAQAEIIFLPQHYQNGIISHTWQVANNYVQDGTTFQFQARENYNHWRVLNAVVVMTITDYVITDDDYDQDLDYVGRLPLLTVPSRTTVAATTDDDRYFDGTTFTYKIHNSSSSANTTVSYTLPIKSLSYFGLYCNLPKPKMADVLFSLQWMVGKKLEFSTVSDLVWADADKSVEVEGIITEMRPTSDKLGQKNYVVYKNSSDAPLFEINNKWLEPTKKIYESVFLDATHLSHLNWPLEVKQYTDPEIDDDGYPKCKFNELEAPVIGAVNIGMGLRVIPLVDFDLPLLTQCMEVDIDTDTLFVKDKDILYIDGRKFFIVHGNTDLKTNRSTLTCLLVPTHR